jgi:hypothetical protein
MSLINLFKIDWNPETKDSVTKKMVELFGEKLTTNLMTKRGTVKRYVYATVEEMYDTQNDFNDYDRIANGLNHGMPWDDQEEGLDFWANIHAALQEAAECLSEMQTAERTLEMLTSEEELGSETKHKALEMIEKYQKSLEKTELYIKEIVKTIYPEEAKA